MACAGSDCASRPGSGLYQLWLDCPALAEGPCQGVLCAERRAGKPGDGGIQQSLQDREPIPVLRPTDPGPTQSRCGGKDGLLQPRAKTFIHRLPSTRDLRRDSAPMAVASQFRGSETVQEMGCTSSRFLFDPNSSAMANNNAYYLFYGYTGSSTVVLRLEFSFTTAGGYRVRVNALNNASTWTNSAWVNITDAQHYFELDWQSAGRVDWGIDGAPEPAASGFDNSARRIDQVRPG